MERIGCNQVLENQKNKLKDQGNLVFLNDKDRCIVIVGKRNIAI